MPNNYMMNFAATLAGLDGLALTNHALALGASESTVEGQHVKALAILAAQPTSPVVTDAIAHLQARLNHLRNPQTNYYQGDR